MSPCNRRLLTNAACFFFLLLLLSLLLSFQDVSFSLYLVGVHCVCLVCVSPCNGRRLTNAACSFVSVSVLHFVVIVVVASVVSVCKFQSVPCRCALCIPSMYVAMQSSSVD